VLTAQKEAAVLLNLPCRTRNQFKSLNVNRKYFISSLAGVAAVFTGLTTAAGPLNDKAKPKVIIPPYLKEGDIIGICSPAGHITLDEITPAVMLLKSWGFNVHIGSSIGKKDFTFGGTEQERLNDLQQMLDDTSIKAIMCARGGYGLVRIIEQLQFNKYIARPKWISGFSDVTVLHNHLNSNFNIATLHSKMCNSFPDNWSVAEPIQVSTILSIRQALTGQDFKYTAEASEFNQYGRGEGRLTGGNLSIIASLSATEYDIDTRGKILFLEDTGEYLYHLDRMMWNLKLSGKLAHLAGLVIGGFKVKPDSPGEEFGRSIHEIVLEKVSAYGYPVCFNFPVGHQRDNFALKCGVPHILEVNTQGAVLRSL
jgi:muramoyltetrapeptide carboxypeptidase